MPIYQIKYQHCGATWYDVWSCACDSECPICHRPIEATSWDELGAEPKEKIMPTVTPVMSGNEYVSVKGLRCPVCHGVHISSDHIQIDGADATCEVVCSDCNARWVDNYALTGYEQLQVPESAPEPAKGLDMSHWSKFNSLQAQEMAGISQLKIRFIVQCNQEDAHAFLAVWQMLDAMKTMLDGDVGVSYTNLEASVLPDVLPF